MAKAILMAPRCLRNPPDRWTYPGVQCLTQLFTLSFQYYQQQDETTVQAFIQTLQKLLSIGDILVFQTSGEQEPYLIFYHQFVRYLQTDFKQHSSKFETLAMSLAQFVCWAIERFRTNEQEFDQTHAVYGWFIDVLETLLMHDGTITAGRDGDVHLFIRQLRLEIPLD